MSLWTNLIDDWGEESVVLWNISDYNDLSSLSIDNWNVEEFVFYILLSHPAHSSLL